ncbi:MAG: outer membrane protein assembly factor BamA [Rhodospirillales bacterium]|nr:MAG: outer membrane protein assembly factor BamA [Rhodospirillales bacterium]
MGRPDAVRTRLARIVVEGNQRIEQETVATYMTVRPGDPFGPKEINDSLKKLFATGLFADVAIRVEGAVLIVRVVENPIINRIAFEGNKRIEDSTLGQEVQLRPRVVFTRTKAQNDVERILQVYRRNGRFGATVEPKVIMLEQNRVDLVFEINEGPLTRVARISFVGNQRFSDRTLRGEIFTRESRWYRFFSTADTYDPDQLAFDQDMLRRFYLNKGYADFRVLSAIAELSPDKDAFFITITIEEGERYKFGKIDVQTAIPELDPEPLRDLVTFEEGDWYDAEEVENTVLALTTEVGNFGYAFVDIRPRVTRDREQRIIDMVFDVKEGPRVFVERIDIGGNVRTLDRVIRREFRLVEGDAFNSAKLERSRTRVNNLGYFSRVEVKTEEGSAPDRTVIKIDVAERSTGELGFGAGYSTTDGFLANVSLRERNLLGKGQDIRVMLTLGQRRQEFDVGFTERYFLGRDLSAGVDLFRLSEDNTNFSSFESTRTGGSLRLGYEINERWSQRLRYTLRQDDIRIIIDDPPPSQAILQQEGVTLTSLIGQDLTYDRRDSRINPTEGYFASLSADYAGLGGDLNYVRGRLRLGYYLPITDDIIAGLTGVVGIIEGIDQDIRITDNFFLGGDNLRGFETAGVGPRDTATGDALGGKKVAYGSLQFRFPIGLPDEYGIGGKLFSDFGTLTDADYDPTLNPDVKDIPSLRLTWGTGLSWNSPVGPLSLDFAWPIRQEDFDRTEVFRLRFGTSF